MLVTLLNDFRTEFVNNKCYETQKIQIIKFFAKVNYRRIIEPQTSFWSICIYCRGKVEPLQDITKTICGALRDLVPCAQFKT